MNFHRYYVPGSAVFITQVVQNREPVFHDSRKLMLLHQILSNVKEIHPFVLLGYVFLPDHFHLILRPTGQSNFSEIMHSLKANFTGEYKRQLGWNSSQAMKFWQKRFWDHVIRDDRDLEAHLHYIHFNPLKHGYTNDLRAWEQSSYIEWENRGLYSAQFQWNEPKNTAWGE